MIALALAGENVATAVEALDLELQLALEFNVRLHYKHQRLARSIPRTAPRWQ